MKSEAVEGGSRSLLRTGRALACTPSETGATGSFIAMTRSDLVLQKLSGCKIPTVAEQGRKQEDQKKGRATIQTRGDFL